jgi:transitional endoplasmic reticulum ATPase
MFLFKKNDNIGKYVVVFPHKEGSYAQTYRVKDEKGKVKFLKLIFMEELEVYQYDKDGQVIEVELASSLNHMNLCSFVDSGKLERDGHQLLYVVTEYVKGENLNDSLYICIEVEPLARWRFDRLCLHSSLPSTLSTLLNVR